MNIVHFIILNRKIHLHLFGIQSFCVIESHISSLFKGYYIKNMMSLMFLILLMSWSVFFVPSALVDSRLSISLTLFLAAVCL